MPASKGEKVVWPSLAISHHLATYRHSSRVEQGTVAGFCLIFGMRYRSFDNGTADAHGQ
jgi:hypothetical protein